MAKAKAAGQGIGAFFNNPGTIILGGLAIALLFFSGDIRKAFGSFGESLGKIDIQLPEINLPDITFPEFNFPDITFPEFPDFSNLFPPGLFDFLTPGETVDPFNPPDEPLPVDDPILDSPLGPITPGENCILNPDGTVSCDTGPGFDVCVAFPELCPSEDPFVKTPAEIAEEQAFINSLNPPIAVPEVMPPIVSDLPPGFEIFVTPGSNVPGGSISETPITCNSTLGFIIDKLGVTASQAADIRAQACNDFGDFDFGTNTGSGFGPGDDPTGPIITGGATLESEEKKAACLTCELFGLNCGICSGSI